MALKKRNKVSADFNMASLTDIIFLLLIFFMLSSSLVSTNALNLNLPSANTKVTSPPDFISVSVKENGIIYIGKEMITESSLEERLIQAIEAKRASVKNSEDVTVVLNAEEDVTIKTIAKIMEIGANQRIKMVLATKAN
jgi:biopolymer transport protein ExbD